MPRFIIHRDGIYAEWSTNVDAPVTYGTDREDFLAYMRDEHGRLHAEHELPLRMKRAEECGTSCIEDDSFDETVSFNRAGFRGTILTPDEIYRIYMVERRQPVEGEGTKRIEDLDDE